MNHNKQLLRSRWVNTLKGRSSQDADSRISEQHMTNENKQIPRSLHHGLDTLRALLTFVVALECSWCDIFRLVAQH